MDRAPVPPSFMTPVATKQVQLFREHNDPPQFICTVETCQKRFGRKEHLARHMRARMSTSWCIPLTAILDANDKPYKCREEGCDADFTRSDLLKRYSYSPCFRANNDQACRNQASSPHAPRVQSQTSPFRRRRPSKQEAPDDQRLQRLRRQQGKM